MVQKNHMGPTISGIKAVTIAEELLTNDNIGNSTLNQVVGVSTMFNYRGQLELTI